MRCSYRVEVPASDRAEIEALTGACRLLEDLVQRAHARTPPLAILDVVVQDEYTHDVIVRWNDALVLVFDTT